MNDSNP